ncbi:hypothetical protein SRHO_G00344280 [Serrasalmus rhombeus]
MKPHRSEPEPERSSSPGSNSDVPPSQLKATSEITPAQQASWMDTASSQMLRCLAELQQARLSSSKKQKKQLLRALKSCLSARCPAFDGYDQEPTDIEISCECEQGCRASEVQEFSTLPRVLILHVMRFDMLDYGEKLKDRMDIPAQLDLSDFPGVASLGKQSSGSTSFQASPRSSLRPGVSTHRPLQTAWCCVSFGEQLGQR